MAPRITRIERRMARIIQTLLPVVERKSIEGAGPCIHDILNNDEFTDLLHRMRDVLADEERRVKDSLGLYA